MAKTPEEFRADEVWREGAANMARPGDVANLILSNQAFIKTLRLIHEESDYGDSESAGDLGERLINIENLVENALSAIPDNAATK